MFVHLPLRASFVDVAERRFASGIEARRAELRELAHGVRLFVDLGDASQLGLDPTEHLDMFHVRPSGAARVTEALAAELAPLLRDR